MTAASRYAALALAGGLLGSCGQGATGSDEPKITNAVGVARSREPKRDPYAHARPEHERRLAQELENIKIEEAAPTLATDLQRMERLTRAARTLRWDFRTAEADWTAIEKVVRAKARVLVLCSSLRDKDYDLAANEIGNKPSVSLKLLKAGVYPDADPASVKDPGLRAEYEQHLADYKRKAAKFNREWKLQRLIEDNVWGMGLFLYPQELRESKQVLRALAEEVPDARLRERVLNSAKEYADEIRRQQ